jgi:hypothetical protein
MKTTELPVSQGEVLRQIDNVKKYIDSHQTNLPETIFQAMDGVGRTFLAYRTAKGDSNWSKRAIDVAGNPIWSLDEGKVLEEILPIAAQIGGGLSSGDLKFTAESSLVKPAMPDLDFSIDKTADSIKQYLASIDEKNRQLSEILGPVALVKSIHPSGDIPIGPFPPYVPVSIPIPIQLILVVINAILEACRLLVSNHFFDIKILRQILSFILSIFDVLRGNWKDGVLTFMGVFGSSWMIFGMIGKTARWVYNFIAPDIQQRIESDIFAGGKSMLIGSWLWLASVVSPGYVRDTINQLMETAKQPLEVLNQKISEIEQQAQITAASIGAKVEFPRLPLDKIPSFDDIQNFQTLLHQPEIYCSPAFQNAMGPAMKIPILRVVFELINIPTSEESFAKACANQPATMVEAVTDILKPTVTIPTPPIQPIIKGGKSRFTRRKKKQSRRRS